MSIVLPSFDTFSHLYLVLVPSLYLGSPGAEIHNPLKQQFESSRSDFVDPESVNDLAPVDSAVEPP